MRGAGRWSPAFLLVALLLMAPHPGAADPLDRLVLVIDPGHGDGACGSVPADPGASAESIHGTAWECVFTWDTAMRLRKAALARGAAVSLTLSDPQGDYAPAPWSPDRFPSVQDGSFRYKRLVEVPEPATTHEALLSRPATANRIFRQRGAGQRVVFLSLHFDSTSERLAGVSLYYPSWTGGTRPLVRFLDDELRRARRSRTDLDSGEEVLLSQASDLAVLNHSENPDSVLIELGNLRSRTARGENPDLWRMRNPGTRQEYADLGRTRCPSNCGSVGQVTPPATDP